MRFDRRGRRISEGNNVVIESYFGSGAHHPRYPISWFCASSDRSVLQEAIVLIAGSRDRALSLSERVDVCGQFVVICILNEYYVGAFIRAKVKQSLCLRIIDFW